jgi:GNAT superfamily N-acetyltransferase
MCPGYFECIEITYSLIVILFIVICGILSARGFIMNFLNTVTCNFTALFFVMVCAVGSALCMNDNNPLDSENGVHDYNAQRDQEAVVELALEHMQKLASDFADTPGGKKLFLEWQVLPALSGGESLFNKVYLLHGKPVGYVNYRVYQPWHRALLPYEVGPNAVVNHLAVSSLHQGKGYGTELLTKVLKDCEEKSVNRVELTTTSWTDGLDKYYKRFGFEVVRESKYTGCQALARRLKPSPICCWCCRGTQLVTET